MNLRPAIVPEALSVERVAGLLDLCERTILRMIHRGELYAVKIGRQHRIPRDEIARLRRGERRAAPRPPTPVVTFFPDSPQDRETL